MTQEEFNEYIWDKKWSVEVLHSPDLASRRQKSRDVRLISLDRERAIAVFCSERDKSQTYTATLTDCTCMDFVLGHGQRPCKHIFRLAEELGLFTVEELSHSVPYERKILPESLHFADDRLVETYINILRFIYRGRRIRIKQFEHALSALDTERPENEKELQAICKEKRAIRKKTGYMAEFQK